MCYKRGLIDVTNKTSYSVIPEKDEFGVMQYDTSLKDFIGSCPDFKEEVSLRQSNSGTLCIVIDRTLKGHAKLAGEGIEYYVHLLFLIGITRIFVCNLR